MVRRMILGIGTDLCNIERIERTLERFGDRFRNRVFTDIEQAKAERRADTPGTYAKGGAGLTILWGWFESPFDPALVMGTEKGLCGIGFAAETGAEPTMADLKSRWPKATFIEDPTTLRPLVDAAFGGGEAKLHLIGAPFQIKVWEALLSIPSGPVTTYSEIADSIGNPRAVRAVGTAVGRNPVSWLIPCHRALRKSGGLGGYHWGLPVKRALLAYESARAEA